MILGFDSNNQESQLGESSNSSAPFICSISAGTEANSMGINRFIPTGSAATLVISKVLNQHWQNPQCTPLKIQTYPSKPCPRINALQIKRPFKASSP